MLQTYEAYGRTMQQYGESDIAAMAHVAGLLLGREAELRLFVFLFCVIFQVEFKVRRFL